MHNPLRTTMNANRSTIGLFYACGSFAMYSVHTATMKWLSHDYSFWQVSFVRSIGMLVIIIAIGRRKTLIEFLRSPYKIPTAFRGVLNFLSVLCFYFALATAMPFAEVTTVYSTAPLIVVVLSAIVLQERIGALKWIAVVLGFAGAAVAANPGGHTDLMASLLAVGSALFWAVTIVLTRKSGARESLSVQMFTASIVFVVLSATFMTWKAPLTLLDDGLIVALGVQVYIAQLLFFEACRFAPASLVGPLEYTCVPWSILIGFLVFAEMPSLNENLGAVLIIVSGATLALSGRQPRKICSSEALVAPRS